MSPALTVSVVARDAASRRAEPAAAADAAGRLDATAPIVAEAAGGDGAAWDDTPVGRTDARDDDDEDRGVVRRAAEPLRDLGLPPGLVDDEPGAATFAPAPEVPDASDAPLAAADAPAPVEPPRPVTAGPGRPVRETGVGASPRRPWLEGLVALVLGAAGAIGVWYSVPEIRAIDLGDPTWNAWVDQPEPLQWAALGGALGLLVAWAVVRWMARGR